jgi:hypothetical protein
LLEEGPLEVQERLLEEVQEGPLELQERPLEEEGPLEKEE